MNRELELASLCKSIRMPEEAEGELLTYLRSLDIDDILRAVGDKRDAEAFKIQLGDDPRGWKMLTCMLLSALGTRRDYERRGIGEDIFLATMGCFSRFVREHRDSFGGYGFDRGWWTVRQLNCQLFRLGALEFEMGSFHGEPSLRLHIPSDADLSPQACRDSYRQAGEFFRAYFPDFRYRDITCTSWLLAPALREVLASGSKILAFQEQFVLTGSDPEDMGYVNWIFKKPDLSVAQWPQDTSLQRNIKKYVKQGYKIGNGEGRLKQEEINTDSQEESNEFYW